MLGTIYLRGKLFLFLFLLLFLEEEPKEYENSLSFGLFFVNVYSNVQLEQLIAVLLESFTAPQTVFQIQFC